MADISPEKIKEKLKNYLKKIEYNENLIDEISSYVDNEQDVESLYQKIKFLHELGVPNEGIEFILSENPLFLTTTLESVKNSVNFLKNLKFENIARIIEIYPELLSVSDKKMSENFKLLKVVFPQKNEALNIIKINMELLTFNTDFLGKRLELFIKNGLKDNIRDIIVNHFIYFDYYDDEIKIDEIKKMYNIK